MSDAVDDTLIPALDKCPAALRDLPGWLIWRFETVEGEKKPRKVPVYADGGPRGKHGTKEDRDQLVKFATARGAAVRRGFDGVGFAPMPEWGITALDFDSCVTDGQVDPDVERLVAGTYAEVSPSGKGVRAFVRGALVGNRKSNKGQAIGFETFHSSGFTTFTGRPLPITEFTDAKDVVADPSPGLLALCEDRFGHTEPSAPAEDAQPLGLSMQQLKKALDVLPRDMHYDDWLRVGMALHHELSGSDEGFQLWDEWSATSGKYGGSDYGRYKWDSMGRGGQRPQTAHFLVRLANEHGAGVETAELEADDFDVVTPETVAAIEAAAAAARPRRFARVSAAKFVKQNAPEWLVKDVVPKTDLVTIIGESQAGKSFVALDLFAAVARGVPWRGKRVKQGRVLYIAAEGSGGFRNRVKAYGQENGIDLEAFPFEVIPAAPNMLLQQDALDICREITDAGDVSVVVIDTWAQVTPGANESSSQDMGKALAHCRLIAARTKAVVCLIHHMGKDTTKGARGWSGLKAAADAEIEVLRLATGRMVRVSKQKDGSDGLTFGFDLDQVVVEHDEDGDAVTSCVVREAAAPLRQSTAKMGKWQRLVHTAVLEHGDIGVGLTEDEAITLAIQGEAAPQDGGRDKRAVRALEAIRALVARGVFEFVDNRYRAA